ncbi:NAD-dependent epimerase/dehydratase family protein [Bordetella sp. LUAb4]|uniref:NAD-dependent epimerase/dehydratase family protein n=1 Tax=Bordetella sp. LUAb4 TaxID=2843195 RepID=UPI001E39F793|nr:NAD-dependent epimerase/dehydratase family protein [Bordetella sp. LUAb4]
MQENDIYIRQLRGPVLVLGASGFVGANLFRAVASVRQDVFAVVQREKSWRLDDIPDDRVIAVDLTDNSSSKNLIDSIRPQTVFDCVAYGAYSFEEDASKIYATNFQSLVNLVGLLSEKSISAFVHAGSSSEYGINSIAPAEGAACEPNSHYSVSKIAAESFLRYMGKQKGFPCTHLRLYSVYGPLEDTSRLVPNVLKSALAGKLPPFVDSRTSRDFVHVDDVCRAFILAAARMNPDLYGETFNIGSGVKTTIGELAELVRQQFGITDEPAFGSMEGRSWDTPDWYADPSKAGRMLDWKASTPLAEGLQSMSGWIKTMTDEAFASATKKNLRRKHRSVSAIIACYKDAEAIPHMYRRLTETFRKLAIDYEIIFVNDCSPDNSIQVIEEISARDPHVIGISHSRNFGSQMAFRSGMELATMNSVVLLDGDLQDPPELIEAFHEKWDEGYDVVYGRRIKREMPWHWGLMYKAFYRVFAAFSYVPIPYDAGDFSLMDRRVVGWLLQCSERDLFMRGLRAYVGFKQVGVDYIRPERMFGRSTNNLLKNIDWAKRGIFSFSNAPLALLTSTGFAMLGISLVLCVVVAVLKIFFPDIAPRGATTLLITILLFGSLNLFALGLVGEYVGKIMLEVKGRPRLIRSALIRHGKSTDLLPDGKTLK